MQSKEMFNDMKVLELASVLAGPSVGQFFAELGAQVIKVENSLTGGDVTRSWYTSHENGEKQSAYFCSINWGKKSIDLNLEDREELEIFYKLVKDCDILITSYKPGDDIKLRVDYETVRKLNERIIYGQITGYGSDNKKVGYDAVIQAESGFIDLNGERDGSAHKMPVALVDILAGHQLKEAILVALIERNLTGRGKWVEVSLIQTALASLANQASNWLYAGYLPVRQGSLHPNIAPYGETFKTKDEKQILLAIGNDNQFSKLCQIIGITELPDHADFHDNKSRVKNRARLKEILEAKFFDYNAEYLMERFTSANVPAGLIQNLKEAFMMKESKDIILQHPNCNGVRTYIAGGKLNTFKKLSPPPRLGEHKEEILNSLKE